MEKWMERLKVVCFVIGGIVLLSLATVLLPVVVGAGAALLGAVESLLPAACLIIGMYLLYKFVIKD